MYISSKLVSTVISPYSDPVNFEHYYEHAMIRPFPHFRKILPSLNMDMVRRGHRGYNLCDAWTRHTYPYMESHPLVSAVWIVHNLFSTAYSRTPHFYLEARLRHDPDWYILDRTMSQFPVAETYGLRYGFFAPSKQLPKYPILQEYYTSPNKLYVTGNDLERFLRNEDERTLSFKQSRDIPWKRTVPS